MLLEAKNLSAAYAGSVALNGVSLDLREGEMVGICGANKAGKTTLSKCLAGNKLPDSGKILFAGEVITTLPAFHRLKRGISLCPEGRGIYSSMTVQDNLRLGCNGIGRREQVQRMQSALNYFPILAERLNQPAGTLSGGEAQMLGIAKRLLQMPRLLIVDEPALGLAPKAIDQVFNALSDIRKDFGATVIVIEEVIIRLAGWVDRAYVLHLGAMVAEGTVDQLLNSEIVAQAYTGELSARRIQTTVGPKNSHNS